MVSLFNTIYIDFTTVSSQRDLIYKSMAFHQVINETIRLGNIVPAIFRKVVKDKEIKGRFKSNKPNSSMFNVYMLILYEMWVVQIIQSLQVGSFWLVHQQFI